MIIKVQALSPTKIFIICCNNCFFAYLPCVINRDHFGGFQMMMTIIALAAYVCGGTYFVHGCLKADVSGQIIGDLLRRDPAAIVMVSVWSALWPLAFVAANINAFWLARQGRE